MVTAFTTTAHQHDPCVHYLEEGLLGIRTAAGYNEAEQRYSALLYQRMEQLLKGERNSMLLLRKYLNEPARLAIMPTPESLDREALRVPVVERLAMGALVFLSEHSPGGPVAQERDQQGRLVESRKFSTKFPHIIVERVDIYPDGALAPESIEWRARRVQNQRHSTRINRMLDAANLTLDVVKLFVP